MTPTPTGATPAARSAAAIQTALATRVRELGMSLGFAASARAAINLGVPDALGDQPATAAELAPLVDAHAPTLERLLRALTCHDVFQELSGQRFAHTGMSRLLRADAPGSMRFIVLWATAPWTWEAWPRLADAVRTGKQVFDTIYGTDFFDYLARQDAESADTFDGAMTQSSNLTSAPVAEALNLSGVTSVVDVGGGQGHLLRTLLERHPELHGTLYDLPTVVAGALPTLLQGKLSDRCSVIGGDCRASVPADADLYLCKNVLEWDDAYSLAALRAIATAGRPGSRVALVQNLIEDSSELKVTTTMDLFLLLNVGGKKHTAAGLERLFTDAGLYFTGARPIPGTSLHLIEGTV